MVYYLLLSSQAYHLLWYFEMSGHLLEPVPIELSTPYTRTSLCAMIEDWSAH